MDSTIIDNYDEYASLLSGTFELIRSGANIIPFPETYTFDKKPTYGSLTFIRVPLNQQFSKTKIADAYVGNNYTTGLFVWNGKVRVYTEKHISNKRYIIGVEKLPHHSKPSTDKDNISYVYILQPYYRSWEELRTQGHLPSIIEYTMTQRQSILNLSNPLTTNKHTVTRYLDYL